jgi:hypothetical protein
VRQMHAQRSSQRQGRGRLPWVRAHGSRWTRECPVRSFCLRTCGSAANPAGTGPSRSSLSLSKVKPKAKPWQREAIVISFLVLRLPIGSSLPEPLAAFLPLSRGTFGLHPLDCTAGTALLSLSDRVSLSKEACAQALCTYCCVRQASQVPEPPTRASCTITGALWHMVSPRESLVPTHDQPLALGEPQEQPGPHQL